MRDSGDIWEINFSNYYSKGSMEVISEGQKAPLGFRLVKVENKKKAVKKNEIGTRRRVDSKVR